MLKILSKGASKRKGIDSPPKADKAVQCDAADSYLRILILEKLPKFANPSDENFDSYLKIFCSYMEILKIDQNEKVSLLFACFQGKALEMIIQSDITVDTNIPWQQTTTTLHHIFDPSNTKNKVSINQLKQLKQLKEQSLENFIITVTQVVNNLFPQHLGYTDTQREMEIIRYFVRGAIPAIKQHLKGNKFKTTAEVLQQAQAIQQQTITKNDS